MLISIITPVYNRADLLLNLFNSLDTQNKTNFEWIVVDDGSLDHISQTIAECKGKAKFEIKFLRQENKGKHVAVMAGLNASVGDYVCIIDSDDELLPEAIDTMQNKTFLYPDVNVFLYLKTFMNGATVGKEFGRNLRLLNLENVLKECGDKLYLVKRTILPENVFPVFSGEKFVTESFLWNKLLSLHGGMGINIAVYKGDYLNDGLTKDYHSLLRKNPKGTFAFVSENLAIRPTSIAILKQTAFHYQAIIDLESVKKLVFTKGFFTSSKLLFLTLAFILKKKINTIKR